jgi:hypothetical protein
MDYRNLNCSKKIYIEESTHSKNNIFVEKGNNIEGNMKNQNIDKNNIKIRRAWLCPHIHNLNYARGKCQNCYSNFYHKSKK